MTDYLLAGLALVVLIAAMTAIVAAITLVRRKVRKEIGLWIRHSRYHPARPPKIYHIDDQIGPG